MTFSPQRGRGPGDLDAGQVSGPACVSLPGMPAKRLDPAGFSEAYSSLLAFIALPTKLKEFLKFAAAPYLYSGPSPHGLARDGHGRLRP
jgi:hypothetical protein